MIQFDYEKILSDLIKKGGTRTNKIIQPTYNRTKKEKIQKKKK